MWIQVIALYIKTKFCTDIYYIIPQLIELTAHIMNNPDPANLPDLTGKIAIITGSNTGMYIFPFLAVGFMY